MNEIRGKNNQEETVKIEKNLLEGKNKKKCLAYFCRKA